MSTKWWRESQQREEKMKWSEVCWFPFLISLDLFSVEMKLLEMFVWMSQGKGSWLVEWMERRIQIGLNWIGLENFERNMKKFQQIPRFYYYFFSLRLVLLGLLEVLIRFRPTNQPTIQPNLHIWKLNICQAVCLVSSFLYEFQEGFLYFLLFVYIFHNFEVYGYSNIKSEFLIYFY